MLNKLMSYFFSKIVYSTTSKINQQLEVCLVNGKYVLDSKNTNFSYGNLQKVLEKGLESIGKTKISNFQNVLLLGVGAGCVIDTLTQKYNFNNKIIGVELDEKVIEIAQKYFNINRFKNLDLIHYNAFEYVLETKLTYDFIIIDIFQDDKMPNFLFESFFIKKINDILNNDGVVLMNTMVIHSKDKDRNMKFIQNNLNTFNISSKKNVEYYNELIFLMKK